jgi:hypothetical protein
MALQKLANSVRRADGVTELTAAVKTGRARVGANEMLGFALLLGAMIWADGCFRERDWDVWGRRSALCSFTGFDALKFPSSFFTN